MSNGEVQTCGRCGKCFGAGIPMAQHMALVHNQIKCAPIQEQVQSAWQGSPTIWPWFVQSPHLPEDSPLNALKLHVECEAQRKEIEEERDKFAAMVDRIRVLHNKWEHMSEGYFHGTQEERTEWYSLMYQPKPPVAPQNVTITRDGGEFVWSKGDIVEILFDGQTFKSVIENVNGNSVKLKVKEE
jgi:hypothetical protein